VLTKVVVSPKPVTVQTGVQQAFTVSGQWSDGSTTVPSVTWSATGGTITTAGVYTAGSTAGTYRVVAKTSGGVADTSVVTVTAPVVTALEVTPGTASVVKGTTQQFSTSATWSDGGTRTVAVTYAATGGTITSGGLYKAGSNAGNYRVIASCTCGKKDTAAVAVTVPTPTLTGMTLTPATVTLAPSATQQFGVAGQWSDGSTTAPPVTYSATGGTITTAGLYTAPAAAGTYQVIAAHTGGTIKDTSVVTVQAAAAPPPSGGGTVPQGTLFNANFDNGTLGALTSWGSPAPKVVSDPTANGGKAVQFDWRKGDEQNIGLLAQMSAGKKVYVRVRYKQGANADNSGIKKTIRIRATIDGVSDRAIGTLDIQWGGWNFFGDDFGDGDNHFQTVASVATAGPDTFRGVWRYLEFMVDYTTAGYQKAKVWVDGVQVLDASVKLSQAVPSNMNIDWVYLASVFNGPSDTRSEWFDDVAISTDYIGVP
jgi:hypothetical protein